MASNPGTTSRKANGSSGKEPAAKSSKAVETGTKIVIRRLPPGLTQDEFWANLGDEWKPGNGKVDWARFDAGKVAKEPAEGFVRVIESENLDSLAQAIQEAQWHDARNTSNDSCLIGPPCVEKALLQKVPGSGRTDPKAGTIDQEPSYQAFLHNLANPQPASKEKQAEKASAEEPKESTKITETPLTKFIKEKHETKAAAASSKNAKHGRQESQGSKAKGEDSKKKGKEKETKSDKIAEKEKPKEPIKLLTKKSATQEAAEAAHSAADKINAAAKPTEDTAAAPKSRRAAVAAAAKVLQRDLGLSPGSAHRRARHDAAKAEAQAKAEASTASDKDPKDKKDTKGTKDNKETKDAKDMKDTKDAKDSKDTNGGKENKGPDNSKSVPTGPKAQPAEGSRRTRGKGKAESSKGKNADSTAATKPTVGPIVLLKKEPNKQEDATPSFATTPAATLTPPTGPKSSGKAAAGSSKSNAPQKKTAGAQPSTGATRAFVKHANPSQGVTEALLKQAMEVFGTVTFVEIDKRKGFAYVDFGDHQTLCKAIAASPVSVASATVQVLERKDKKPAATAAAATPASTPASASKAPAADTTPATGSASERPKRGGRGRGRRGGNGGANAGGNSGGNAAATASGNNATSEAS